MASTQSKHSKSTQETRDLLSSVPKQKAWMRSDHIYQYQNSWYGAVELQGALNMQKNFKALDTDLIVATYPKCGTTWLKALCFAIVNRYDFDTETSKQHHPLLTNNPHLLLPFLDHLYSTDNPNPDLTSRFSVINNQNRLLATHFPLATLVDCIKDSKCKLIYICRDPKDTITSYWHFLGKMRTKNFDKCSLEEFCNQFCEGVIEYGSFWDHALGYWKMSVQFPERVCFLKYEELKKEPKLHVVKLAEFLGYPFSAEEESEGVVEGLLKLCSFDHLRNLEVNKNGKLPGLEIGCSTFFRRGEVGDHANCLTPAMIERLDKITEEKFFNSGLKLG